MKKTAIWFTVINFIFLALSLSANAQTPMADNTPNVQAEQPKALTATNSPKTEPLKIENFKAGGTVINIPQPCADLEEVGYDVREQMEIFVPATNRLLAGYMRSSDIPQFMHGNEDFILNQYASIQVARQGEYQDCTTSDFKELVDYVQGSFSNSIDSIIEDSEDEFNRRMESMDFDKVSIDKPVQLGTLFSKPDAYSMGMISTYSNGTKTWTLVIATTFLRVHKRLLFVYLFNTYKSEEDVIAVRKLSEQWADAILAANK